MNICGFISLISVWLSLPEKKPEGLKPESDAIFAGLDFRGKTVMDIGAWQKGYSLLILQPGASDVLAIDSPTGRVPIFAAKRRSIL